MARKQKNKRQYIPPCEGGEFEATSSGSEGGVDGEPGDAAVFPLVLLLDSGKKQSKSGKITEKSGKMTLFSCKKRTKKTLKAISGLVNEIQK